MRDPSEPLRPRSSSDNAGLSSGARPPLRVWLIFKGLACVLIYACCSFSSFSPFFRLNSRSVFAGHAHEASFGAVLEQIDPRHPIVSAHFRLTPRPHVGRPTADGLVASFSPLPGRSWVFFFVLHPDRLLAPWRSRRRPRHCWCSSTICTPFLIVLLVIGTIQNRHCHVIGRRSWPLLTSRRWW